MAEPTATAQLMELVRADQRQHWEKADRILAETYLQRHPALQSDPALAVEIVYHEILLREELGETFRLDEYLERFPQLTSQLKPLFEVHHALEAENSGDTSSGPGDSLVTPPETQEPVAGLPTVPGYEILGRLGRGGMGIVYKARQQDLNRPVALKMILAGSDAEAVDRARFRSEAESQARLQHANIVQIHQVGEAAGRPYLALEYVDGGSLAEKLAGQPQPPRSAAELIETLARAMHSAHERGLIHRDLKPANVLLTADGTPKITDFGLAKRMQAEGGQTKTGDILGTPSYMAPEQAGGPKPAVGPAVDVYALGAILYEMLTGRPPFLGATPVETLLHVRYEDPVPVRRLRPKVPRDLETVCLKCLERQPAQRYATALALADDLRRFTDGRPIMARPLGWWGRGVKWAKRRPAVAAAGGVTLVLAVAAWAVSTVLIVREKNRTEDNLRRVLQAMDEICLAVLEKHLPQDADLGPERRNELLQRALNFYEDFTRDNQNNSALQRELGRAFRRVADIHRLLGQRVPANAAYRQAITYLEDRARASAAHADLRQDLGQCYQRLGVLLATPAPAQAEEHSRRAAALQEQLIAEFPDTAEYRADLGCTYNNLSWILPLERPAEAKEFNHRALELFGKVAADVPGEPKYRYLLATAHVHLGQRLAGTAESVEEYRRAQTILETLVAEFDDRSDFADALGQCCQDLGNALRGLDQPEQAEQVLRRACQVLQPLTVVYPKVPGYWSRLAGSFTNLGLTLHMADRLSEAEAAYRQALQYWDKVQQLVPDFAKVGGERYNLGVLLNNLGDLLRAKGDVTAARLILEQSVAHHRAAFQSNPQHSAYRGALCQRLQLLAEVLVQLADHAAADDVIAELLRVLSEDWDDYHAAARCLARCAAQMERASDLSDDRRHALVAAYDDRAQSLLQEAVRRSAADPEAQNYIAWWLATSSESRCHDGKQAVALARHALDLKPQEGNYWNTLGVAYVRVGDWPAALAALHKSVALRPNEGDSFDWFFLAIAYWHQGQKAEAHEWFERAVRWREEHNPNDADLRRFHAEAATLLRLPQPPNPAAPARPAIKASGKF
jgi:tetratricopeptide (TPR) repeat protein